MPTDKQTIWVVESANGRSLTYVAAKTLHEAREMESWNYWWDRYEGIVERWDVMTGLVETPLGELVDRDGLFSPLEYLTVDEISARLDHDDDSGR